jgi:hypothetical protein
MENKSFVQELAEADIALESTEDGDNAIASVLKVNGGLLMVVGAVAGFIVGILSGEFNWTSCLIVWIAAGISGLSFLGFGEIIRLLQEIVNQCTDPKIVVRKNANSNEPTA